MAEYKTLLLVDDDIEDQEIFLSVIEKVSPSIECQTAINGAEALQLLLSKKVHPDVIFLDLNMPLMNGKQFLTEIKKHEGFREIPVIILSTSSDKQTIHETRQLGAYHFITKPDKFSIWESTLKTILSNSVS